MTKYDMKNVIRYFSVIKLSVAIPLLSGCYSAGSVDDKVETTITGTVIVPDGLLALMQEKSVLSRMLASVFPEANAMISGEVPLANAKVVLRSLTDNGYVEYPSIIVPETRTNSLGYFAIKTMKPVTNRLLLEATGANGNILHALVIGEDANIDIVSEYVYRLIQKQVTNNAGVFLAYFSNSEMKQFISSIRDLDINLSTVSSVGEAIDIISVVDAGALANMIASVSTPNLDGKWMYVKKSGPNTCGNPIGVELIASELTVSQVNDALTIYIDGSVFSTGTLFGRSVVGLRLETYVENGGTVVQTSSEMTVAPDNATVDGAVSWDWFGPSSNCSGTDIVSVARL